MKKASSLQHLSNAQLPQGNFHIPQAGIVAVSEKLGELINQDEMMQREFTAHFKIDQGMVVQGSFRKDNGHCPDVLFEDFELGPNLSRENPQQTFLERCRSLAGSEIDKINEIMDLVIGLIIKKTVEHPYKTFYGCDYQHPHWQSNITKSYRVEGSAMPIGEFVRLGFGDCRIVNGLLAFGLNACGVDATYSYKQIFSQTLNESGEKVSTKTTDHVVCIVEIEQQKYIADAFIFRLNGHSLKKLISQHIKAGDQKDIPIGVSDLYKWRENIGVHSQIVDASDRTQTRQIKQTNPFPTAKVSQPAIQPYLQLPEQHRR